MKKRKKVAPGAMAGMLMAHRATGRLGKASLRVTASMDAPYPGEKRGSFEREEAKRLKSEISGIQSHLKNWDPEDVAARAFKSLKSDLMIKKARLQEYRARVEEMGDEKMSKKAKKAPVDWADEEEAEGASQPV